MTDKDANGLHTSVVIPTYNGASRVGDVLVALNAQDAVADSFEVIVVDNKSTDGTAEKVARHPAWRELMARGVRVRVVHEARQGLMFARICGVLSAAGRFVCFLDDDTAPDREYVREGTAALSADDKVGLLVSRLRPKYEGPVPASIARREHLLAINGYMGEKGVDFGAVATMAPTLGAGLWVRRSVFLDVVPWRQPEKMLPDRIGNQLISGNDIEIGYLVGRAGFRRLYCPKLRLEHRIPATRLKTFYVVRLIQGIVRSALTLDERYDLKKYTTQRRAVALGQLLATFVATPAILLRRDGLREAIFVLANRIAELQGPFRDLDSAK